MVHYLMEGRRRNGQQNQPDHPPRGELNTRCKRAKNVPVRFVFHKTSRTLPPFPGTFFEKTEIRRILSKKSPSGTSLHTTKKAKKRSGAVSIGLRNSTIGWSTRVGTIQKEHHHGDAGRRSSGMAFVFPAAPPRQPLRKGLTEGGV